MEQPKEKLYTYEDYLKIDDGKKHELIGGIIYDMASPSPLHQKVVRDWGTIMKETFKECEVIPDIDVLFEAGVQYRDKIIDCVRPDVSVICETSKVSEDNVMGPPDLIIEVLSNSNSSYDSLIKRELYERNGVLEYWMIDPKEKILYALKLVNSKYELKGMYKEGANVKPLDREAIIFKLLS